MALSPAARSVRPADMTSDVPAAAWPSFAAWPRALRLLTLVLLWSLPGAAALSYYYLNQVVTGQPMAWGYALVSTFPWWYVWALLTPLIVALARRFPLHPGRWAETLLFVHAPVLVVLLAVHATVSLVLFRAAGLHDTLSYGLWEVHLTSRVYANILAYAVVLAAYHAVDYYRLSQQRARQAARLELELARAHLRALKMQLNPHFLFNTLHSVAALVRKGEQATAVKMLGRLGEFLRLALENQGAQEIPLEQEVDFLERYLEIEKLRFGDRLTVRFDVEAGAAGLYVPNLILQPLVENAIHHGLGPRAGQGQLVVTVRRAGDVLHLSVQDDGAGTPSATPTWGVGLTNTAGRLRHLYGEAQSLDLEPNREGGVTVRLTLPAHDAPVAGALPDSPAEVTA